MFPDKDNTNTASGKFFTVVTDQREWDNGFRAWSFFHAETATKNLEDAEKLGDPSILMLTSKYYSGEDVTGIPLGSA